MSTIAVRASAEEDMHARLDLSAGETPRLEEILRLAEARTHALLEMVEDLICILEADGAIRYASPSYERILGYPPDTLIGRNSFDFFDPEEIPVIVESFRAARLRGEPADRLELRVRHADGTWHILESVRRDYLDDPAIRGVVVTSRDITARHQAEQARRTAEARLATVLASAPLILFALDREGRYTLATGKGLESLGIEQTTLLGRSIFEAYPGHDRMHALARRALAGEVCSGRDEIAGAHLDTWYLPEHDAHGAITGLIGVAADVSERAHAAAEARAAAERLAAIVATQQEIATAGTDLEQVMAMITERARILTAAAGAVVEVAEGEEMVYQATSGSLLPYRGTRLSRSDSLSGRCMRTGEILRSDDCLRDRRTDRAACARLGIGSMIVVPLLRGGEAIGVLKVAARMPHAFADHDVQTLKLMAGLLGAAMDQALAFEASLALLREYEAMMQAMEESDRRAHTLVEKSPLGTCIVDEHGVFETVNPAYAAILGYVPEEMLGRPCTMILPRDRHQEFLAHVHARLEDVRDVVAEYEVLGKDGRPHIVWSTAITLTGADGRPRRASFIMDITERKQAERQLSHAAHHDALTGLPNRVLFADRLGQALRAAERDRTSLAILLIDLDGFKAVNDDMGHAAGDALLRAVAGRLRGAARKSDTVARLGGDEFAVLLPHTVEAGAVRVATKMRTALAGPFALDAGTARVGGSIGIALYPEHADTAEALERCADQAMYAAKRTGGGYLVYDDLGGKEAAHSLGGDLRRAVAAGELRLHYQPVVRCATGVAERAEALLRWQHPRLGLLSPDRFIPLAERTGTITALTVWVLEEAIRQCAQWRAQGLGLGVAVNVSPLTLEDPQFADLVGALLRGHGLPAEALTLEITESSLLTQSKRAVQLLGAITATGVRLAIDDFGSGYSSLSQLRRLPVQEIKLDRGFLADLGDEKSGALLAFVLGLGSALGVQVVAEGVETRALWETLGSMGCEMAQGYFMFRPQPPEQLETWLRGGPFVPPAPPTGRGA